MKWIFAFFSLVIFLSCQEEQKTDSTIKFLVREYKIINDTVENYNSRFAKLKKKNHYTWTKLMRFDSRSSFGYVDSFHIFDSLVIKYSLDENMEIDKIYNWAELKSWSQIKIDEMLLHYDKPISQEMNKLLEIGTDSSAFVSKNIWEIQAYSYYNLLKQKDAKELFKKTEDDDFYYYNIDLAVDESDYNEATSLIRDVINEDFKIDGGKNTLEIIVNKSNGNFVMAIAGRELISSETKVLNQIIINRIEDFSVSEINKHED